MKFNLKIQNILLKLNHCKVTKIQKFTIGKSKRKVKSNILCSAIEYLAVACRLGSRRPHVRGGGGGSEGMLFR